MSLYSDFAESIIDFSLVYFATSIANLGKSN